MINKAFRSKEETTPRSKVQELSKNAGISTAFARLLCLRGIDDHIKYKEFIQGTERSFCDPFLLPDMEKAARRVYDAVLKSENILIYGDYDADGVTSVALLYLYLKNIGAKVSSYIPSRLTEGYGMNRGALDEVAKNGVSLIITVDTGITAVEEIEYASSLGMDVVVTDHHECQEELPRSAVALVDPKRSPEDFCEYAGVGVALKLASAVEGLRLGNRELACVKILDEYCDVAAIGTVADIMSLTGENRFIVRRGLEKINSGKCRKGILALLEASQKKIKGVVNSKTIGYAIAPRINAAGRMGSAETALKLLLCDDPYDCESLAGELCELNQQRQNEEMRITEQIIHSGDLLNLDSDRVIVLGSEGWHHGVIGIVCSKVVEYYKKPVILLSYEDDIAKGSCRSVDGFNIVRAIEACSEHVVRFGGHDLAAGVTLKTDKVEDFKRAINEYALSLPECETNVIQGAEMKLSPSDMTLPFALELKGLEPFGKDNPEPVFLLEGCEVMGVVGLSQGKHTKVVLRSEGISFEGLMFSKNPERLGIKPGDRLSVIFTLDVNEYMNKRSISVNIKDVCFEGEYGRWLAHSSDVEYSSFKSGTKKCDFLSVSPKREDFIRLYAVMKQALAQGGGNISYRQLVQGGETYFDVRTRLDVFCEAGLLTSELSDDYGAFLKLKITKEKADIESTPTFIRLKEISKKNGE